MRVGDALLVIGRPDAAQRRRRRPRRTRAATATSSTATSRGGTTLAQLLDAQRAASSGRIPRRLAPLSQRASGTPRRRAARRFVRSTTLTAPGGDWRLSLRRSARRQPATAQSWSSRARSSRARSRSTTSCDELLVAAPLALLLASLAGYGLAAAALRPVEAMRRRAAAVSATAPGRLPVPPSRDEISRLATTLNEMLERLEAAFEHERRFVADASHELRTPLALLRTELEVALRRPRSADELEATLRSAAEETERLSRLAEDLLLIARADQGALPIRREHVAAEDVLATRRARASRRRAAPSGPSIVAEDDRRRARRRSGPARAGAREPRRQRARARRRAGRALRASSAATPWSCTSPTTARASPRTSCRAPSTASAAPTRRAAAAERASASRSSS